MPKSPKPCKAGQERNPQTGRCRKSPKPCKAGQERNPQTGRCRKSPKRSKSRSRSKSPKRSKSRSRSKSPKRSKSRSRSKSPKRSRSKSPSRSKKSMFHLFIEIELKKVRGEGNVTDLPDNTPDLIYHNLNHDYIKQLGLKNVYVVHTTGAHFELHFDSLRGLYKDHLNFSELYLEPKEKKKLTISRGRRIYIKKRVYHILGYNLYYMNSKNTKTIVEPSYDIGDQLDIV